MNPRHDFNPQRIQPDGFTAIVEIPKGSKKKYELDKETCSRQEALTILSGSIQRYLNIYGK
jgi:hypothetical protein